MVGPRPQFRSHSTYYNTATGVGHVLRVHFHFLDALQSTTMFALVVTLSLALPALVLGELAFANSQVKSLDAKTFRETLEPNVCNMSFENWASSYHPTGNERRSFHVGEVPCKTLIVLFLPTRTS